MKNVKDLPKRYSSEKTWVKSMCITYYWIANWGWDAKNKRWVPLYAGSVAEYKRGNKWEADQTILPSNAKKPTHTPKWCK